MSELSLHSTCSSVTTLLSFAGCMVWLPHLSPPSESELPETALLIPVASLFQQVGTAQGGYSVNVAWLDEYRVERVNE